LKRSRIRLQQVGNADDVFPSISAPFRRWRTIRSVAVALLTGRRVVATFRRVDRRQSTIKEDNSVREFEYAAPVSVQEAIELLCRANGEARPLAGGTDLIAQMKESRKSPALVIDVKGIPDLNVLSFDETEGLRLGAAVSCTRIARFAPARARYHALVEACALIGSVQIQNRAAVGGNFCNATPSADTVPPILCYGGTVVIAGPSGRRRIPAEEFFIGPGQTVLAPDEILVELSVPPPPRLSGAAYLRFIPREEMDIAVAGVGSLVELSADGMHCQRARIALAAVAPTPVRAREAEEFLAGKTADEQVFAQAAELAASAAKPISDVRGSAAYRTELVKVLTRRSLQKACERVGGRPLS
jgi:carbon-monoxide dehydrogenase medium subunit